MTIINSKTGFAQILSRARNKAEIFFYIIYKKCKKIEKST